jgi:hypothetical protein
MNTHMQAQMRSLAVNSPTATASARSVATAGSGGCNGDGTGFWYDNSNPNFALCLDQPESYTSVDFSTTALNDVVVAMGKQIAKKADGVGAVLAAVAFVLSVLVKNHELLKAILHTIDGLIAIAGGVVKFYNWAKGVIYHIKKAKHRLPAGIHLHVDLVCAFPYPCEETRIGWATAIDNPGPWGN